MIKKQAMKCISVLITGAILFGVPVQAGELSRGTSAGAVTEAEYEAEQAAEIISEDDAAVQAAEDVLTENEDAQIPENTSMGDFDAQVAEDISEEEQDAQETAVSQETGAPLEELFPGLILPEELTGVGWAYDLEIGTTYYVTCQNQADYRCYMYTPGTTGTYHMDLVPKTGKMIVEVFTSEDMISMEKTDAWTGYYYGNNFHLYMKMTAGIKYVFKMYPDTDRKESGRIRLRQTKELKSAVVTPISNKYLAVGNTDEGAWHKNADGTTDQNVWDFNMSKILSLYQIVCTFADGSKYTWTYSKDYGYIGTTNIQIFAVQETEGWTVGEKAYCNIWLSDLAPIRVEIPYLWFKDVQDPTHAFYKAIYWAASKGITKGYPDNTFGIDKSCTRGEAVMFLWRFMGKPSPKYTSKSPFTDVPVSHAYYKAILWAAQKGITKGYSNGTFGVDKKCTRGAIMMFIWRAKGQPSPKTTTKSPFSDVPVSHAYYKAISWASQKSIAKGYSDGTFGINKDCTRGAIVTFLYRI